MKKLVLLAGLLRVTRQWHRRSNDHFDSLLPEKPQQTPINITNLMPKRYFYSNSSPAREKSSVLSSRPLFKELADDSGRLWLPDLTWANDAADFTLPPEDDPGLIERLTPCSPATAAGLPQSAAKIAQWAFDTYCVLVKRRLKVYNKYRKQINDPHSDNSPITRGRYGQACRLLSEQILRRDLPVIPNFSWEFLEPTLPIFEIVLECTVSPDEIVEGCHISGIVEICQHHVSGQNAPGWSSSSSSSSSSSFDIGYLPRSPGDCSLGKTAALRESWAGTTGKMTWRGSRTGAREQSLAGARPCLVGTPLGKTAEDRLVRE